MDDRELSWVAGTFESEGTIGINKGCGRKLGWLYCTVASTDKEMLDLFEKGWPGKFSFKQPKGNRKPVWTWTLQCKRAAGFLEAVRPFLRTSRVKDKVSLALEYQATKNRAGISRRAVCPEYRTAQAQYYELMRALNHRGVSASSGA